jgi:uncharacterized protein (TIGR03435 family)
LPQAIPYGFQFHASGLAPAGEHPALSGLSRSFVAVNEQICQTPPVRGYADAGGKNGRSHPETRGDAALGPIYEAVEQQLGLKLRPVRRRIETVVIDHVEKTPAEN